MQSREIRVSDETERLKVVFEDLIRQYRSSGQDVSQDQGPAGNVRQEFFCRVAYDSTSPPNTGAALIAKNGSRAEYRVDFFVGQPKAYGQIMVGENRMEVRGGGRGVSGDEGFVGGKAHQLADTYDDAIVQAAANVYGIRILHSRKVDMFNLPQVAKLIARGYDKRPGYFDIMDRIFEPEI